MNVTTIVIKGRIPSKKNRYRIAGKRLRLDQVHQDWKYEVGVQLLKYKGLKLQNIQEIQMDFYWPDNRKADLDNKSSSVLDILVNMEIIKDDSWQHTGALYLRPVEISKKNPRVEIFIKTGNKPNEQ